MSDTEQILAYLEDQIGPGSTEGELFPAQGKSDPRHVRIEGVFENKGTFSLAFDRRPGKSIPKGHPFILFLVVSGHRVRTCEIHYQRAFRDNQHIFTIPKKIYHAERRSHSRVSLPPRDKSQILILEGLDQGTGLHGRPLNLCERGMCLKVDKAMHIKSQRFIPLTKDLFKPGQPLYMVRIKHLVGPTPIECSAEVRHLTFNHGRYMLGIRLANMGTEERAAYMRYIESRHPMNHDGFPLLGRIRFRDAKRDPERHAEQGTPAAAPAKKPVLSKKVEEASQASNTTQPSGNETARVAPNPSTSMGALLITPPGEVRDRIVSALAEAGVGSNCIDDLTHISKLPVGAAIDVVFLYQGEDHNLTIAALEQLRQIPFFATIPMVLVCDHLDMRTKIAAKSHGVSRVLAADEQDLAGRTRQLLAPLMPKS
ncbi:PilZ domain-containing protein [Sulfidibacter corallicola]|uniref:PilZ domain-containing protein n=1 Tax=Sulfidibacter corallicola TaxID=2818388 RepID=A0A8A4TR28_SULCO|nr:PilZ domain-containing protein [Sulfidibacter corallicola]QTD51431.1 PilZ domain-containing protein [Sulfidibacter corallicola]